MKWIFLLLAIIGELIATSALKESDGYTKIKPAIISIIGYAFTFYFLSLSLRHITMSIAYAVWAGVGIILMAIVGYFRFKQSLDAPAVIGIFLILMGVTIINAFSKTLTV